jgi:hypothetical protein
MLQKMGPLRRQPNLNLICNDVYVGLFITSHEEDVAEQAVFSNVRISIPAWEGFVPYRDYGGSHVEILEVSSGDRTIIYSSPDALEAPN